MDGQLTASPPAQAAEGDRRGDADNEESAFLAALREAVDVVERAGIRYALIGGIASTILGRARMTHDIDLFMTAEDAGRALAAFAEAGYATEETNPQWIYKATKGDIVVDVIFELKGGIRFDDEMAERAAARTFRDVRVRVLAPEDLVVAKATNHDEQTPRHWHDALGIIAYCDLDWDYLLRRARLGPRRVLSLLIYAQSDDLLVSDDVIRALFELVYPPAGGLKIPG